MTPNDMLTNTLMGNLRPGEVTEHKGDLFVELQDLYLADDGCYFTTKGGSRIPISLSASAGLGSTLGSGGIVVIRLPGAFIKATAA
jgi:hypothetical protein